MPPTIIDLTQASSPAPAEPEIPSVAVLLKNAIAEAQSSRVRSILVAICDTSPEAARIAANHLLVSEDNIRYLSAEETSEEEEQEEDNEDDEDDAGGRSDRNDEGSSHDDTNKSRKETSGGSHTKGLAVNDVKRMRTRYAMCVNCNEEFEVADNVMGSCCWHDGELEQDYDGDFWADHDERCHGPIDTEENRSQYPEGFIYDCCNEDGYAEGCKTGRHVEPDFRSKRRQY